VRFTEEDLWKTMSEIGWEKDDQLEIKVGGTQVYEIDGHGTKWSPVKGTRKYNKDAFIVIARSTPVVSSQVPDSTDTDVSGSDSSNA
tara:strand:+ start:665 stop:925 length:261 start_codon:yes stop_codon:yes gene_type:complete